jgi:cytochrome c-type biogenesis protein CcmH/NrfF
MILSVVVPEGEAAKAYEKASTMLLCDCGCNPQSIKECACGRAEDLRVSLAKDAAAGRSGDEIIAAYVAKHGQKILVSPPASGFNLVAWAGPAIGLLAAALMIALTIRRWRRASAARPQEPVVPTPPADDAYLARLRREIEDGR